ncbi:unnamed protein product [Protopolystoma xenopodis]|uniref:Uncharacterized protein n=1 Tax=Protopolystoma xenopodis TaxID=117903 RepID=A0A3S5FFY4_9PLAT|nr:unnamed protein product [Protopolystoma xenopodis]
MTPCSDEVGQLTDESSAPFHRNRTRLPRKQRQQGQSTAGEEESADPSFESLHATITCSKLERANLWFPTNQRQLADTPYRFRQSLTN